MYQIVLGYYLRKNNQNKWVYFAKKLEKSIFCVEFLFILRYLFIFGNKVK